MRLLTIAWLLSVAFVASIVAGLMGTDRGWATLGTLTLGLLCCPIDTGSFTGMRGART